MSAFEIVRQTRIDADPGRVHDLVNDLHRWQGWSPWEGIDPGMSREYDGPDAGVGASYCWSGNRKAGSGSMLITESSPEVIGIQISFLKPFKATNQVTFEIVPAAGGSEVAWRMSGEQSGLGAVVGMVFSMDKLVGKDFERGLARLKELAES
ncbi:MAG: SRPBCC family protein [Nocardioidaceae bacterium]|nr:SRPBCC family protein [Nocardioidaceae bacterium]